MTAGETRKTTLDRSLPQSAVMLDPKALKEPKLSPLKVKDEKQSEAEAAHEKDWWPASCRGIVG